MDPYLNGAFTDHSSALHCQIFICRQ